MNPLCPGKHNYLLRDNIIHPAWGLIPRLSVKWPIHLTDTNLSNIPPDKRLLYRSEYCIIDGVLCREIYVDKRSNLRFCVCIPEPLEHDCILAYHERPFSLGSHASGKFMYANMKRHIYFKHMLDKSVKFAQSCILCNRVKLLKQPQTS